MKMKRILTGVVLAAAVLMVTGATYAEPKIEGKVDC